jgi:hypothetical protein
MMEHGISSPEEKATTATTFRNSARFDCANLHLVFETSSLGGVNWRVR